ncbi:MAG TPA: hypothetical protein VGI70_08190 [Polyangiales bacterium]|jgi:2-polyprenyl-6-methoxyphenol hydroxylase-like FAD-dependent oxidoreductase
MRRAIVIGGSVGGLCAARALDGFFDEVLVVERERFADSDGALRPRTPHLLLPRGALELEALFPGFVPKLKAAGAPSFDPGSSIAVRRAHGWQPIGHHGSEMLWASRELIATTVRALLQQQTRVRLIEQTRAVGLRYEGSPARRRINGVVLGNDDSEADELSAELVVDASGRHSHADDWLRDVGLCAPLRDTVDAHAGYASRIYRAPSDEDARSGSQGLLLEWHAPGLPRAGAMLPIEGDRFIVTLAGIEDQIPPTDEAGFRAFMRTLNSPALADAVARAEPLSEIAGSRATANVHRRYDRWRARLPGFIAVADAACAFNPIYGLGLSMAAACGSLLRAQLHQIGPQHPRFAERYFARQAELTSDAWRLASAADRLWPHTERGHGLASPALEAYFRLVLDASHFDPRLRRKLAPVFGLTAPLSRIFEPGFVAAVALSTSQRRLQQRLFGAHYAPDAPPLRIAR